MYPRDQDHLTSKDMEAGFHLCESSRNRSTTASSSTSNSTSSLTVPSPSTTKKRKWYKPNLRINLHKEWIWVGFVRAGHTTPTGQATVKDDKDEWEQLPAYAPPEEVPQRMEGREGGGRNGLDNWIVEPPESRSEQEQRGRSGMEPPPYR